MVKGAPTMRELMQIARQRFGAGATRFKTRGELLDALARDAPQHAPRPSAPAEAPVQPERSRGPAELPLVTRDFFRDP